MQDTLAQPRMRFGCRAHAMTGASQSARLHRSTVPAPVTPLVGRRSELAELGELLVTERVITLTGAGGCGKSRLAAELARRVADRFAGGVGWIDLTTCSDFDSVLALIAGVLDVVEHAGDALLTQVVHSLSARPPVLLVLDNAEHVLAAAAAALAAIATGAAQVHVVSTSREPIGVPGERVWRVPSLETPPADTAGRLDADALMRFDAVELFVERAGRARRAFALTAENANAVGQICSRLDGLPLAIELAAARVRTMPPERIAAQLDDRFRLLAGGPRTLVARQQTMLASVAWSEALLAEDERAVFRRIGVFLGGFTVEAAEAVVASFGDLDPYDVADVISRLVDKSLVQLDEARDRYGLLETIRSYALQRLLDTGETADARDAHARWCADWLESWPTDDDIADVNDWWERRVAVVDRIGPEWPNCASALEWVEPGGVLSLRLVAGLGDFWGVSQGATESGRYGMPAVLAADREAPEWLTAILRLQAVRTNALDPDFPALRDEAIRIATERSDRRAVMRLEVSRLITMLMILGPRDDLLASMAAVRDEALAIHEWYTAWNVMQSGAISLCAAGRVVESESFLGSLNSSRSLLIRANTAQLRGDHERSLSFADAAMRLNDARLGSTMDDVLLVFHNANAALATTDRSLLDAGDDEAALDHLPRSFASVFALVSGVAAILDGAIDRARTIFSELQIDLFTSWQCVGLLAQIELALEDPDAARISAERLRDLTRDVDAPHHATTADLVLAECERHADLNRSLDLAHRALATAANHELWPAAIDALEVIATMLVDTGRRRDAARLLAATDVARSTLGYRHRFAHRERAVVAAVASLDGDHDEDTAQARADGRAVTLVDAVELARRMRGERVRPAAGWDSLTPTELRVAEQVAAGLTNPQIAEKLLMSRATVKTHLVHVYRKLGLASRAELAAALTRRDAGS